MFGLHRITMAQSTMSSTNQSRRWLGAGRVGAKLWDSIKLQPALI